MILGSHNSLSYLPVKKWWMKPIAFTAKCQRKTIKEQYELGVRCFDLRVRFNKYGLGIIAHGIVEYGFTASQVYEDLAWLNEQGGCYVRVIHEVRSARQYKHRRKELFQHFCQLIEDEYDNIHFWCGRNLFSWERDYHFDYYDPSCCEKYASVCPPKILDDWWPWLYARLHNKNLRAKETDKEILLIDYVNI